MPNLPVLNYSVREAAARLGIGRTKIFALISDGELPVVKIGRRTLVRETDLATFIEDRVYGKNINERR